MPSVYRPLVNFVAKAMQAVLNLALLCTGIILVVFTGRRPCIWRTYCLRRSR